MYVKVSLTKTTKVDNKNRSEIVELYSIVSLMASVFHKYKYRKEQWIYVVIVNGIYTNHQKKDFRYPRTQNMWTGSDQFRHSKIK